MITTLQEFKFLGDLAMLLSDNTAIRTKMNWTPKYDDLTLICQSAFEWEIR
ncbi:MAG: hypothetical protein WCW84_04140 [Sulfurimonas sp.]|jgi:UDP-glucose 4-epimerase